MFCELLRGHGSAHRLAYSMSCAAEVRNAFPLPGQYHFRFKAKELSDQLRALCYSFLATKPLNM